MAATDTRIAITAVDKTRAAFNSVNGHVSTTRKAVLSLNGALAGIGVAGFGALIKGTLNAQNNLYDLSARLGVTTEGLSRLHHAAELSGVSANTMNMGLQRMTRRLAEAKLGTGEAVKALQSLGLSANKLSESKPEEQFSVLADALHGVTDPAERVRLAFKFFDAEGVALLQTMTDGSAGLREMGAEADRLGVTVSQKTATGAMEANAGLVRLKASATGVANAMAQYLGPTIAAVSNWLADKLPAAARFTRNAFRMATAGIMEIAAIALTGLQKLYQGLSYIPGALGDTYAEIATNIGDFRDNIKGAQGVIFESIETTTDSMGKFAVATGAAIPVINDYTGATTAAAAANKALNDQKKLAATDASQFESMRASLLTEEEALRESYAKRHAIIIGSTTATGNEKADLITRNEAGLKESLAAIEEKDKEKRLKSEGELADSLAGLAMIGGKKQFNVRKMFALKTAIMEGITAVQGAWASAPFPANIPAVALTVGKTAANVAKISGMAHDGIDSIPQEGTWLLDKGERVVDRRTNSDLKEFLNGGGGGAGGSVINVHNYSGEPVETSENGRQLDIMIGRAKAAIADDVSRGTGISKTFENVFNLSRKGVV